MTNTTTNPNDKTNTLFIWGLFLLTPLLSLVVSAKNIKAPWAKNIIWAFTAFYGFTFSITSGNANSDINRYISWFYDMRNSGMDFDDFRELLYVDENYADLLQPSLTFLFSRFTDNHVWLIMSFGIIFGYFYSRNLWYIAERLNGKANRRIMFLLFVFALAVPIWYINGFRFWTATHIFFYGLVRVFLDRKKIYFIPIFLTVFVHFSFVLPISLTLLYFVVGNRLKLYFYIFVLSLFVTEINLGAVSNSITGFLPEVFVERSAGYVSQDDAEESLNTQQAKQEYAAGRNWYAQYYLKAFNWAIMANLIFIFYKCKDIYADDRRLQNLLAFLFYFYAIANVLNLIPSGVRYVVMSNFFAMAVIIFFIQRLPSQHKYDTVFKATLPLFILYSVIIIKEAFNSLGLVTIAGNPIVALFMDENIGLISL